MRYREISGCSIHPRQHDPRKSLSLYVSDGESAECEAIILHYGGKVLGTTTVPATGGMTIQVRCATADAAYDLFDAWLDRANTSPSRMHTNRPS